MKREKTIPTKMVVVLGGTFDPIHKGHIQLAKQIVKKFNLEKLIIMPCKISPHRDKTFTTTRQRIMMIKLAIRNLPQLELDLREIRRASTPSYTINTLRSLRRQFGENVSLCWVMGEDSFQNFLHWHKWQHILNICNLIVSNRPQYKFEPNDKLQRILDQREVTLLKDIRENSSGKIFMTRTKPYRTSSTELRGYIKEGRNVNRFLPPGVYEYILKHNLYNN